MDIEKLIHRLITKERLEKNYNSDYNGIYSDAATVITDLLARAKAAEARAEKAEMERDDAVGDLETIMFIGDSGLDTCDFCKNNQCYVRSGNNPCLPKWRGIKEV